MKMLRLLWLLAFCPTWAKAQTLDVQGHRGARGLAPENTLPAFVWASDLGVTTLELDVVVSADGQVVVSHEPFFNADICTLPNGQAVTEATQGNLYALPYAEIKTYDCGLRQHPKFSQQHTQAAYKPLLSEVLDTIEQRRAVRGQAPVQYNVEIKSSPQGDGVFHPAPAEFSTLVYEVLAQAGVLNRTTLQSFDFRVLRHWHRTYPEVALAALTSQPLSPRRLRRQLGFMPQVYSSYYPWLTAKAVKKYQAQGVRVIPWTLNEPSDMERLLAWGVDGIITDYPDRLLRLLQVSH